MGRLIARVPMPQVRFWSVFVVVNLSALNPKALDLPSRAAACGVYRMCIACTACVLHVLPAATRLQASGSVSLRQQRFFNKAAASLQRWSTAGGRVGWTEAFRLLYDSFMVHHNILGTLE